ncbi:MAG TPA: hypothetical protein VF250_03510 [Conexibacter sp.]
MGRGTQARGWPERPVLGAALLLALLVLAYLWPALIGGKVFSPDAVLYKLAPWQPYQPADVASYENYLLADVPLVVRPWHELVRQLLRDGVLPAWNPYALTGISLLANPQTGLFSPLSLPLWTLPFEWAFGLVAALKLWVAGLGTFLLVRELRLAFLPGLLAAVAFAFCSMNVMWLMPEAVPAVVVWLPWLIWLVERLLAGRGGTGTAVALACVTAAALGGGHPGSQVHVLLAAGGYALLRAGLDRERAPPERLRGAALALGALVAGIALVGAMLIPELLSSHATIGTLARRGGASTLPGHEHMPFGAIRTPLFPDWWGRPSAFETDSSPLHAWNVNYEERTFYAGVVALLLACAGLTNRASLRRQAPFLVLGALGLAMALHAPGLWWLASHLPALELVENQRLHFVFELAVAVLAAFGLQAVLERPGERRRQLAVVLGALAVGLGAAVTSGASAADAGRVAEHFLTGRDFARTGVVELTAVAWFLLLALALGLALLALRRWPARRSWIAAALVLVAAFDMLHFAHGYNPMGPPERVTPPRTPALAYLQRHRAEGRVAAVEIALLPDAAMRYGLADVRGYDPPYPTRRFYALWQLAEPDQEPWRPMTITTLTPAAVQVTGALGTRFVLAGPGVGIAGDADPAVRALRRVYAGPDATVFRNPHAAPRAFVPAEVQVVPDAATARATLADSAFDASRTAVVVERDQRGAQVGAARGDVTIASERNAGVTLRARLARPGLVVLGDQLLDGWSVRVDGRAATPIRVNEVLRGVVVGAGAHEIEWSYRVPGLRAGAALSAAAALLLVCAAMLPRVRRRRRAVS